MIQIILGVTIVGFILATLLLGLLLVAFVRFMFLKLLSINYKTTAKAWQDLEDYSTRK
jgi:hypothetical protein